MVGTLVPAWLHPVPRGQPISVSLATIGMPLTTATGEVIRGTTLEAMITGRARAILLALSASASGRGSGCRDLSRWLFGRGFLETVSQHSNLGLQGGKLSHIGLQLSNLSAQQSGLWLGFWLWGAVLHFVDHYGPSGLEFLPAFSFQA